MTLRFIRTFLLPAAAIILISLYAIYPSFNLALFGDDWQQIWKYFQNVGPNASFINHLTYFISGYGSFEVLTGLLYIFFGHNYQVYYQAAYLYKLIAAFSIWPLVFYLTKSKLAAFYASLFLSVTIIGLESTNWVVNSPAYLAVANLSLFLYFFIKSRDDLKVKTLLFAILFFYLAHVFAPIRMTGLLLFTIFLELFLNYRYPDSKLTLRRLFFILISFVFISLTSTAAEGQGTLVGNATQIITSGFATISTLFSQGRTDFLFYPIMTVGRLILPNTLNFDTPLLLLSLVVFVSILVFNISPGKKNIPSIILGLGAWTLISWLIYSINKPTLSLRDTFSLAIGGYTIILGIILIVINKKSVISILFFMGVFWTLFSFIFPWVRAPETLHPTEHRYLVASMIGIAVLFASIIGLGKKQKNRSILFILVLPFLIINIVSTRTFFEEVVLNSHGKDPINKMWSQLPYFPQIGKSEKSLIFYFESPAEKQGIKHHSLTFGFPYKIAMMYNIHDADIYDSIARMPISTNDWKDVVSMVSSGDALVKYGLPEGAIPINNIYAFFLTSDYNLIDITAEARKRLEMEIIQL